MGYCTKHIKFIYQYKTKNKFSTKYANLKAEKSV